MVLIDALYINKGGGAVLLEYLIEQLLKHKRSDDFFFLLDPRFDKPTQLVKNFAVVNNTMSDRLKFYKQHKGAYSTVFCFANTPPPVRIAGPVYTYSHNQKLLVAHKHKFSPKYLKPYLKYLVIKLYNKNTDYYIVQTPHMVEELVGTGLKDKAHCLMLPFYDDRKYKGAELAFDKRGKDAFVFVSNPSPQKNHITLFDAWEVLLDKGYTPTLHVTIDETGPQFIARIEDLNSKGAKIVNHRFVDPKELYFTCPYLIYPAVMESFGLPLIEAVESGMKVIASDLPYVLDVIKPSLVFDTLDKLSMADAVIKAMNSQLPDSELVTRNEVERLVSLLAGERND